MQTCVPNPEWSGLTSDFGTSGNSLPGNTRTKKYQSAKPLNHEIYNSNSMRRSTTEIHSGTLKLWDFTSFSSNNLKVVEATKSEGLEGLTATLLLQIR
jgi:hypothetical protein